MAKTKKKPKQTPPAKPAITRNPKQPVPASWINVLDDYYCSLYHMDTGLREAATIAAATLLTTRIPGDPLWLYVVGPPSTGKTVIVDSLAADAEHCESVSKLTAKTLVSGWVDPNDPENDPSLFPRLKGRALLVKDFTAVMTMGSGVLEELYGLLRDCYDGKVRVPYGNGKIVEKNDVYFPLIAAVTDAIKGDNRSHLGERFLRCEVLGPGHDDDATIDAAMGSVVRDPAREAKLAALGQAISDYLKSVPVDLSQLPDLEPEVHVKVRNLSRVIGHIRAFVERDHSENRDMLYRPRAEGGARVAKQLKKLGIAIALLLQKKTVDDDVFHLIRKVGMDTVEGLLLETLKTLMRGECIWTTDNLRDRLRRKKTSLVRNLYDLEEVGVIERYAVANLKGSGRDSHAWRPTPDFKGLWLAAGLNPSRRRSVV